jgi:hypothetical protein
MTYRWAVICEKCYQVLDNECGIAVIDGRTFNIAATSRGGNAQRLDDRQYRRFRQREARKVGIDLEDEDFADNTR